MWESGRLSCLLCSLLRFSLIVIVILSPSGVMTTILMLVGADPGGFAEQPRASCYYAAPGKGTRPTARDSLSQRRWDVRLAEEGRVQDEGGARRSEFRVLLES